YITFSSLMRPPPPPSTLFPYTTLFRSQAVLPKGFIKGSYKINAVACIAFKYKILYTFSIVFAKITDHRQFHAVVREYVKDLSCQDRKSTRLNSSHVKMSYAVFCLKKKT